MKKGYFGEFGGCFVPELLMPPLQELEEAMRDIMPSPTFKEELDDLLRNFAGRETPADCTQKVNRGLAQKRKPHDSCFAHNKPQQRGTVMGQSILPKFTGNS